MKPGNLESVGRSFALQAENFESGSLQFSRKGYLEYTAAAIAPSGTEDLLEAAAGTCVCGRSLAPRVRSVVCLDATPAILDVGRREAAACGITNISFVEGCAEDIPFPDGSFDIVFSRLAFHHFTAPERAFAEMRRCLRPGGKLVMVDMEAAEEGLRAVQDSIEAMRDPSHVRNLSMAEMLGLFESCGLRVEKCEKKRIRQDLSSWMALTKTPGSVSREIVSRMRADLEGGERTGFYPYVLDGRTCFDQRWVLLIGIGD